MTTAFQKKGASILASVFIGLIILSFMFTGYQQGTGPSTPDTIGEVDGTIIRVVEYQRAYQQRLDFWERMMGKRPSSQEIEQFGIKDQILNGLVEQKLLLNFANELRFAPAATQVIETIQGIPAFQKEGKFDVDQYKVVLRYNGMAPNEFEKEIENSNRMTQLTGLLRSIPVSKAYLKERQKIQEGGLEVSAVQIKRDSLLKHVFISPEKIKAFIANSENKAKLESYFQTQKHRFNTPAQVSAAHILLRITPERDDSKTYAAIEEIRKELTPVNFEKMANEKTEDPSGKGKGGDLGTFPKGRMVEEFDKVAFEQPVGTISGPVKTPYGYHIIYVRKRSDAHEAKLTDHQEELAKEILQKEDKAGQKALENKVVAEIKDLLQKNNLESLKKLQQEYEFAFISQHHLSPLDDKIGSIVLQTENLNKLVNDSVAISKLFYFDQVEDVNILWSKQLTLAVKDKQPDDKDLNSEQTQVQNMFLTALNQDLMKELKDRAKIKLFRKLI